MPILNITQADHFENFVNTHNKVLCLYYWKLCGYCQRFAPIWNSVIQHYRRSCCQRCWRHRHMDNQLVGLQCYCIVSRSAEHHIGRHTDITDDIWQHHSGRQSHGQRNGDQLARQWQKLHRHV